MSVYAAVIVARDWILECVVFSKWWIGVAEVSVAWQLCSLGVCCGAALYEVSNRRNVICLNRKAFFEN